MTNRLPGANACARCERTVFDGELYCEACLDAHAESDLAYRARSASTHGHAPREIRPTSPLFADDHVNASVELRRSKGYE
jgi:hypothetical protein